MSFTEFNFVIWGQIAKINSSKTCATKIYLKGNKIATLASPDNSLQIAMKVGIF